MDLRKFDPDKIRVRKVEPRVRYPFLNQLLGHIARGSSYEPYEVDEEAIRTDIEGEIRDEEEDIRRGNAQLEKDAKANPGIRDFKGGWYKDLDDYIMRRRKK